MVKLFYLKVIEGDKELWVLVVGRGQEVLARGPAQIRPLQ